MIFFFLLNFVSSILIPTSKIHSFNSQNTGYSASSIRVREFCLPRRDAINSFLGFYKKQLSTRDIENNHNLTFVHQ